jgi:hypothetical protein
VSDGTREEYLGVVESVEWSRNHEKRPTRRVIPDEMKDPIPAIISRRSGQSVVRVLVIPAQSIHTSRKSFETYSLAKSIDMRDGHLRIPNNRIWPSNRVQRNDQQGKREDEPKGDPNTLERSMSMCFSHDNLY